MSVAKLMRSRQGKGKVRSRMYWRKLPRGRYSLTIRIRDRLGVDSSMVGESSPAAEAGGALRASIRQSQRLASKVGPA